MKTLENTLTRPHLLDEVEDVFSSQASIEAAFEQLENSFGNEDRKQEPVSSAPVRKHIQMLHDHGMSYRTIAAISGVDKSIIGRIIWGKPSQNMGPQSTIGSINSELILALTIEMIPYEDRLVDATGTIRRIQALAAVGYNLANVSEEVGIHYKTFVSIIKSERVKLPFAVAVREAYEKLREQEPQKDTPIQRTSSTKAKNDASKNKWASPKMWNDSTIDDPDQEPLMPCECLTVTHEHGTRDAYLTDKCRCTPCKTAYRKVVNHRRRQIAYGREVSHLVDAAPAREHVKKLMANGWGVERIAKGAGVGKNTVSRLLYGAPAANISPTSKLNNEVSDRLLAFEPANDRSRFEGTVLEAVDAIGSQRRVQALINRGYSMTYIAQELGCNKTVVSNILKNDRILLTKAEALKKIYDKLWNVEPPRATPAQKKAYTTAKKMAAENKWMPPLAWDDDLIDDPNYKAVA